MSFLMTQFRIPLSDIILLSSGLTFLGLLFDLMKYKIKKIWPHIWRMLSVSSFFFHFNLIQNIHSGWANRNYFNVITTLKNEAFFQFIMLHKTHYDIILLSFGNGRPSLLLTEIYLMYKKKMYNKPTQNRKYIFKKGKTHQNIMHECYISESDQRLLFMIRVQQKLRKKRVTTESKLHFPKL